MVKAVNVPQAQFIAKQIHDEVISCCEATIHSVINLILNTNAGFGDEFSFCEMNCTMYMNCLSA